MESLVETDWLEAELGAEDLRVLDCHVVFERHDGELRIVSGRERWERGHIPTSAHVDIVSDLSDPDAPYRFMLPGPDRFAAAMRAAGVGEGTRVVLYDADMNTWSARVWWMLRAYGFDDAAVLNGGWVKWSGEGRPVSTDPPPAHPPARFEPEPRPGLFVAREDVLAAIADSDLCIVNALGEAQHRGENLDYGRRGHIPGALNVPAASLVDPATHAYHDLETLRRRFAGVRETGASRAITYCGGGVSASSDAFILTLLGHDDVAVYDASMNEWGSDPSLPLEI